MKAKIKVILTIILLSILFNKSYGQEYIRLINDTIYWDISAWEHGYICQGYSDSPPWRAYFNGDSSMINGKVYYHMYSYGFIDLDGELPTCPPFEIDTVPSGPIAYVREEVENQTVYKYEPWNNDERLLFDFSLNIGDTLYESENFGYIIVRDVYPYETQDGIIRKMIVFEGGWGSMLEGIGGPAGPYLDPFIAFGGGPWTMCVVSTNGIAIDGGEYCFDFLTNLDESFAHNTKIEIYPNPCNDQVYIKNKEEIIRVELYNMLGAVIYASIVHDNEYSLSVIGLKEGIYVLRISDTSNAILQRKLIKINSL